MRGMIRRLLASLTASLVLAATVAPAWAAAVRADGQAWCQCPIHDHCPIQGHRHACHMGEQAGEGPGWNRCPLTGFLAVAPLPPAIAPAGLVAPAPQVIARAFPEAEKTHSTSTPPDVPPPKR